MKNFGSVRNIFFLFYLYLFQLVGQIEKKKLMTHEIYNSLVHDNGRSFASSYIRLKREIPRHRVEMFFKKRIPGTKNSANVNEAHVANNIAKNLIIKRFKIQSIKHYCSYWKNLCHIMWFANLIVDFDTKKKKENGLSKKIIKK